MALKVKCNTKGLGPLSFLMGRHSYQAEGEKGIGYGHTSKDAIKDYFKKYGKKK